MNPPATATSAATTSAMRSPAEEPLLLFGVLNPGGDTAALGAVVVVEEVLDVVVDELAPAEVVLVLREVVDVVCGTVVTGADVLLEEELDEELEELLEEELDELLLDGAGSVWAEADVVNPIIDSITRTPASSETAARRLTTRRVPDGDVTDMTLVGASGATAATRGAAAHRWWSGHE